MTSHFRTLLAMLTKWTRQPWTSSFNHHTLVLQSAFDSPYSGIHNIDSKLLTCYANSRILWVAYIPDILYQAAECLEWNAMIAWSFFLCHSWFTTAKKRVNFIGDNEIKKLNTGINVWTQRGRQALVQHTNFPAPFWSNSWPWGWENRLKCDKISLSQLNKIVVWGKI